MGHVIANRLRWGGLAWLLWVVFVVVEGMAESRYRWCYCMRKA